MATLRPHSHPAVPQAGNLAHTTTHTHKRNGNHPLPNTALLAHGHARSQGVSCTRGAFSGRRCAGGVRGWQPCEEAVAAIPPTFSYHNVPAASRFRLFARPSAPQCSPYRPSTRRCGHTSSSPLQQGIQRPVSARSPTFSCRNGPVTSCHRPSSKAFGASISD